MRLSHVYQPLLIRSLVAAGGMATLRQLAMSLLVEDESQIVFYENRIKQMPLPVLKKHKVVTQAGDLITLATGPLTFEQRSRVRLLCEQRLQTFLQERGLDVWAYRMLETDPVPEVLRYQALAASGGRCTLCGVTRKEATLHVDHIIPRSRGGKNTVENLQVLCWECNCSKANRDSTDFRVAEAETDPGCLFCSPGFRGRAVAGNQLAYAVRHEHPVTEEHTLVIPFRHTPDYFSMTTAERNDADDLLRHLSGEMRVSCAGVEGFHVAAESWRARAFTPAHAHIHLIPRRRGDGLVGLGEGPGLPPLSPGSGVSPVS
ncbi:MAG TPA: HIT family hydrolase [Clostridiales bacterium]|nr:HIT family hydrolase [Clostridiales bacterium]